jgi:hypothetical protein
MDHSGQRATRFTGGPPEADTARQMLRDINRHARSVCTVISCASTCAIRV